MTSSEPTALLIARGRAAAHSGTRRRSWVAAKLSIADVARDLGMIVDSVQRWEQGTRAPRAAHAARYA